MKNRPKGQCTSRKMEASTVFSRCEEFEEFLTCNQNTCLIPIFFTDLCYHSGDRVYGCGFRVVTDTEEYQKETRTGVNKMLFGSI